MKRIVSFILTVAMLLSGFSALAESEAEAPFAQ